ncbi:MAG: MogA/MoaB family molybdenum cofactor biosynthesis protein [Pyrinomonadaceae bacterium]|nr:MogA/MoaB family molybdenum cofactor biosynthesis protein [Pyrinomonadaceae bacterium]
MKPLIKAAVVTASDSRHLDDDVSGTVLVGLLIAAGAEVHERLIVKDDLEELIHTLHELADRDDINLILTTGGTGFAPRDVTPEATRAIIEREAPGIAEAIRRETAAATPMAMLSRGVAGIRGNTLIINFPGSPRGVTECFEIIRPVLGHAIDLLEDRTNH